MGLKWLLMSPTSECCTSGYLPSADRQGEVHVANGPRVGLPTRLEGHSGTVVDPLWGGDEHALPGAPVALAPPCDLLAGHACNAEHPRADREPHRGSIAAPALDAELTLLEQPEHRPKARFADLAPAEPCRWPA
jgi:hypothetical protein